MSTKKKVNPNKIPLKDENIDIRKITEDATNSMVLKAWALMLGALADFSETTQASLVHLWDAVNRYSATIHQFADIETELRHIETVAGISLPYKSVSAEKIKTQGDLKKFQNQVRRNALYAAFALIASPIIHETLIEEDDIPRLLQKAYSLEDSIERKRIKLTDITQHILEDEFNLRLVDNNGCVELFAIDETPSSSDN